MRILYLLPILALVACTYNPEKADLGKLGRVLSKTGQSMQYNKPRVSPNCLIINNRVICS